MQTQQTTPETRQEPSTPAPETPIFEPGSKKRKKRRRIIAIAVVVVLAALLIIPRLAGGGPANTPQSSYVLDTVSRRDITVVVSGSAALEPADSYVVNALVGGEILSADFEEGDVVEKGALLYQIDTGDVENSIERSRLSVERAQMSYDQALDGRDDLVIEANGISKGYGDRLLIDNLSFKIPKGAIVGIIGPNGAGKTTMFRMITGQEKPDSGEIRIGETVDLGYVDQSREELNPNKTVWEEISDGLDIIELGKKQMPSRAYVGQFNFKGGDQQKKVGQLSGGERNRVHLAKMLRKGANVILLDESYNDLDVDTLRSLEEGIMEYPGCVLVTSHDRWFLDRLATHILAYEGDSQVVWFEGNFEEYEKDKRRRLGDEACNPHRVRYKKLA